MATFKNKKHKPTKFQSKSGYLAQDLAESEGITCDALHMRVRNYGSPFQRAKKGCFLGIERLLAGLAMRQLNQDRARKGICLGMPLPLQLPQFPLECLR